MNLEDLIKEQIENIDINQMVRHEIRSLIGEDVKREALAVLKERIKEDVNAEIDTYMKQPIQTDDGWNKRIQYESFEAMYKKLFQAALRDDHEIKRSIEGMVRGQMDKFMATKAKEIAAAMLRQYGG